MDPLLIGCDSLYILVSIDRSRIIVESTMWGFLGISGDNTWKVLSIMINPGNASYDYRHIFC